MKESWKPGTMIYPLPAVLVGCGDAPDNWNLLTVAWTGTVCTAPPMCYVSVRPERHSHALIARTGEFTINLTTAAMARAVDWCGVRSGRDYDKFRETGLTPLRGAVVAAPALEESPVVVECRVRQILPLGSHDMFLAEVVNVLVDDRYIDSATGRFDLERAGLVAYSHGEYFRLGRADRPFRLVGAAPQDHRPRTKRPSLNDGLPERLPAVTVRFRRGATVRSPGGNVRPSALEIDGEPFDLLRRFPQRNDLHKRYSLPDQYLCSASSTSRSEIGRVNALHAYQM